ncbi:MAG: hypothetical protein ACRDWN_03200 [Acidimicrobiales bacterium]
MAKLGKGRCTRCGEKDRKLKRFVVHVAGLKVLEERTCRACTAVLEILLSDPRNMRYR